MTLHRSLRDSTISSVSASLRPPVFGRRGDTDLGLTLASFNSVAPQQQDILQQRPQQVQLQQQYQQQNHNQKQLSQQTEQVLQTNSSSSLQSSVSVSTAPIPKFGFRFGGARPDAQTVATSPTDNALVLLSHEQLKNPTVVTANESPQVSPPKSLSSNSSTNQNSLQSQLVAALAPALPSSRTNKSQSLAPPAMIDVSSRAAQLMREIGEGEDCTAAVSTGARSENVWRERSSRSVAGDLGSHIVAHSKIDTGLPRDLASRDRARIAIIYKYICSTSIFLMLYS
jgi:hypothetical protein